MLQARACEKILIPRTLHYKGEDPRVCLVNLSDWFVELKGGTQVAQAEVVELAEGRADLGTARVRQIVEGVIGGDREAPRVPEHLTDLFERSRKLLSSEESDCLADLLSEYQDVFARGSSIWGTLTTLNMKLILGETPL